MVMYSAEEIGKDWAGKPKEQARLECEAMVAQPAYRISGLECKYCGAEKMETGFARWYRVRSPYQERKSEAFRESYWENFKKTGTEPNIELLKEKVEKGVADEFGVKLGKANAFAPEVDPAPFLGGEIVGTKPGDSTGVKVGKLAFLPLALIAICVVVLIGWMGRK